MLKPAFWKVTGINKSRLLRGERGIWQRRYWEHLIRDEDDYQKHVDYIHYNPVKHHYVKSPIDWPYSTIHHHIVQGYLNSDWGCDENSFYNLSFGENNR